MSVSVTQQLSIHASIDALLAVVRDIAAQPDWWPGMRSSEVLEHDEQGRVVRARLVNDVKVARDEFVLRYRHSETAVEWELEGTSLAQRSQTGSWTFTPETFTPETFTPETSTPGGPRTRATLSLRVETSLPLPGFVQRRVLTATATDAIRALKEHVEG